MGADFQGAMKQFDDNFRRIGGQAAASSDPEKYNLYAGLYSLARGLELLEQKVDRLLTQT